DRQNNDRIFQKERAEKLLQALENQKAIVASVQKKIKKKHAPQLYDITELQRDANRIFQFSGKKTLSVMQRLYENHKVLTYPRTDSRVITSDIVPTLKERIRVTAVDAYKPIAAKLLQKKWNLPKSVVDDAKVSDHHAIIPTEEPVVLSDLTGDERKIYDLVVQRFYAVLMDPYVYEETTLEVKIGKERFAAKGKNVQQLGWKELHKQMDEEEEQHQSIPAVKAGDTLGILRMYLTEGETKPPEPFTEGTLLQAMENPVKYMNNKNKKLAQTLHDAGGIGTVATRADIIDKLFNSMYMEQRGKYIYLTSKGKQLLDLVPEDLRSPELTAQWEQKLTL